MRRFNKIKRRLLMMAVVFFLLGRSVKAQMPSAPPSGTDLPDAQTIIAFLNQAIDWHRHIVVEEQLATDPTDLLYLNDDRQNSREILQLSFDFARAAAQLLASKGAAGTEQMQDEPERDQSLYRAAADADTEVRQTQAELEADRQKLAAAGGSSRKKLQSTIDELQSELNLAQSRSQMLHDMLQFVSGATGTGGNLLAQIDQLQRSIPELQPDLTKTQPTANTSVADQTALRRSQPSGILDLGEELFALHHKITTLDQTVQLTDALAQTAQRLRAPLLSSLATIAQRGEQLAKQADNSDPAQLEQLKSQLNALTANFKQISATMLPLSKQAVLFNVYKSNLTRWRNNIKSEYSADLKRLILRAVLFGIVVAVVIALSEAWRRATFRYIHDLRRRYQFLLLRRIVLWFAIGITIAFALATEVGSLATFAGLITAGIAVALQNVILAIVGYFFLIGKYGVRVGDRVQISGVTGDVIDIGLIRLHLMEVSGSWGDRQLTGRIVVFSNAVVFQPNASFYRQIPGTNFVWHQVSLTLGPGSNYHLAKQRLAEAVESVYNSYREKIERQHEQMQRTLSVVVAAPQPQSQLRMTQNGIEVVIRYPIELESAATIDDQMMRELLDTIARTPELKLAGSGMPNIEPATEDHRAA
ncbi:MAG TPA: mechanosensitive ion channel domain-containing protein [Terriglobales bacterium]|nr:mechanosensitive ion channel domain-containing protein [Terriglobales bacterium]